MQIIFHTVVFLSMVDAAAYTFHFTSTSNFGFRLAALERNRQFSIYFHS